MPNNHLKNRVVGLLHRVQQPAQYLGGELNSIRKDHAEAAGTVCLIFPDLYTVAMSHHGLQVLYTRMNQRVTKGRTWACERAFSPMLDMEQEMRTNGIPLYALESFTPISHFDVVGFTLQYELTYTNILNALDLGGIAIRGTDRLSDAPLIIAGGPCVQNPEPLAPFIDAFAPGDGEMSLPLICERWQELKQESDADQYSSPAESREKREWMLLQLARSFPFVYVPRFYEAQYEEGASAASCAGGRNQPAGAFRSLAPTERGVAELVAPAVFYDFPDVPPPLYPIVPNVECVHDRISVEIMRGCPHLCRFCQSTTIKRPLRFLPVETIIESALTAYRNTGTNEVSLLSLSSSDYPDFEHLVRRMKETFEPLGVNISIPSLRVNEQLRTIASLIGNRRRSGLTLAPEVARDDMREQIRKKIKNEDLYEGCRHAFRQNFQRVKLYFMCGLPGERDVDLEGIIEMSEKLSRIGKEETGRNAQVTASVSNFVPKPQTPYQWNGMQHREYFHRAHDYLHDMKRSLRMKSVHVKCHHVEPSLLEGVLSRGDRRVADAIELAWQRGARLDGWDEYFDAQRWWTVLADCGIDIEQTLHRHYDESDPLPWEHIAIKQGKSFLAKEYGRSLHQLDVMADAV